MSHSFQKRFVEFSRKKKLLQAGDRVLVAISGGVDSMVLLHLLAKAIPVLRIEAGVVHLHHGIRGRAADDDAALVEETAGRLKLPFFLIKRPVPELARRQGLSLEEAGHQIRKAEFRRIAAENGFQKIATAHHLDDQAETVLMRMISGSGLQGLAGIRLRNFPWVRPLLFATRREVENFAHEEKIRFREDASNRDVTFTRNKIRRELFPLLRTEYNPNVTIHLAQLSAVLEEWDDYLRQALEKAVKDKIIQSFKNKIRVEISSFKLYFSWIKIRLVEHALSQLSGKPVKISASQFTDFLSWLDDAGTGSCFHWFGSFYAVKQPQYAVFFHGRKKAAGTFGIQPGKWYPAGDSGIEVKVEGTEIDKVRYHSDSSEEYIGGDGLRFPLLLRRWKAADRFIPLGMQHSRLVSDFLTDRKIYRPERDEVFVLLNGDEIVAVLGQQISEKYRVRKESVIIYQIKIKVVS